MRKLDLGKPPDTKEDKDKEKAPPAKQEPPTSANEDWETLRCQNWKTQNPRNQRGSTLRSHNQHKGRSISPRNNCYYSLTMPELIFYSWKFPQAAMMHELKLHSLPLG